VNGIFLQRHLSFPEEIWTWDKYDLFNLQLINLLITDEFYDGDLKILPERYISVYQKLKDLRKRVKLITHHDKFFTKPMKLEKVPEEMGYMYKYLEVLSTLKDRRDFLFRAAILSQTRGMGKPPPIVILQSKIKFIKTVTSKSKVQKWHLRIIKEGLKRVVAKIPSHSFTGLSTKAAVNVTTRACKEYTRQEGGSLQGVMNFTSLKQAGKRVPVRDLQTGKILKETSDLGLGEYIFWSCLDTVLKTRPQKLYEVELIVLSEPGKARSITKATYCLKVVLDVVNKLCSWPLGRGIPSSKSGMKKSHHPWNLFRRFYQNPLKEHLFRVKKTSKIETEGYTDKKITYKRLYASSTDYRTATDYFEHKIARTIARYWMIQCGIPAVLRGIVLRSYSPRKVYFKAPGPLSTLGEFYSKEYRVITTSRGILMGDPLTKVILHLLNASVREISDCYGSAAFRNKLLK
jgi:hypothetical protein